MILSEPSEYTLTTGDSNLNIFKIIKIRNGISPAIITIDGFLNEDNDDLKEWKSAISQKFPNNSWYHLKWESENLKKLTKKAILGLSMFLATRTVPYINLIPLPVGLNGVVSSWLSALKMSNITGIKLSEVLKKCQVDSYILIGHSLGSRVIYACLDSLNGYKIIKEVHLLAVLLEVKNLNGVPLKNQSMKIFLIIFQRKIEFYRFCIKQAPLISTLLGELK